MPYAWFTASCSVGSPLSGLFLDLAFPSTLASLDSLDYFLRTLLEEFLPWSLWTPLLSRVSPIELWDSLSSLLEPWDSLSSFPEL